MPARTTSARSRPRRKKAEPKSRGLTPADVAGETPPAAIRALGEAVAEDGGQVIGTYRDPLGGHWQLVAALPIDRVERTTWQRDVSETHVKRLADAIDRLGRFLDPVIALRESDGRYHIPNGGHRTEALRLLGAKSVVAIVVPDREVAFQILALNTEKAHNLRERALEVIRMARALCDVDDRPESDYGAQFEEPALLTLGACYERNGRFAGSVYHPVLKRCEAFEDGKISKALALREQRAERLLALDAAVTRAVEALRARGLDSPYLKTYVVARVNPIRFSKGTERKDWDATIGKMLASAEKFDASAVRADQIARSGGPPPAEE